MEGAGPGGGGGRGEEGKLGGGGVGRGGREEQKAVKALSTLLVDDLWMCEMCGMSWHRSCAMDKQLKPFGIIAKR